MRLIDADALFAGWGEFTLKDAMKHGNESTAQRRWSYSSMMMYEIAEEVAAAQTIGENDPEPRRGKHQEEQ